MALERRWENIPSALFVQDGGEDGIIVLSDVAGYRVKQKVKIQAVGQPTLILEVKKIPSPTKIYVGPTDKNILSRQDLSLYTLAALATISAEEQEKVIIPKDDQYKASYETEPVLARRVIEVDQYGNFYTTKNPFPVRLSDGSINIGSVNAELEVQLSHKDNVPDVGDVADSVQIGDGEETLEINSDGSININVGGTPLTAEIKNVFNSISSLGSGIATDIVSYTTPVGKTAILHRIEYGGNNIATYSVIKNGSVEAKKRTWFNSNMSDQFEFNTPNLKGLILMSGDIVRLSVVHNRSSLGDFEGRIQLIEI